MGAINFWCGPDNKPANWPARGIKKGRLKYRRDYVGAVFADWTKKRLVRLHFDIKAYSRRELNYSTDAIDPDDLAAGTKADRTWVIRQFRLLRQHVALMRERSTKI